MATKHWSAASYIVLVPRWERGGSPAVNLPQYSARSRLPTVPGAQRRSTAPFGHSHTSRSRYTPIPSGKCVGESWTPLLAAVPPVPPGQRTDTQHRRSWRDYSPNRVDRGANERERASGTVVGLLLAVVTENAADEDGADDMDGMTSRPAGRLDGWHLLTWTPTTLARCTWTPAARQRCHLLTRWDTRLPIWGMVGANVQTRHGRV